MKKNTFHPLTQAIIDLENELSYSTEHLFSWLVDDILSGFGVQSAESPPQEVSSAIFQLGELHIQTMLDNELFKDILGRVYLELTFRRGNLALVESDILTWEVALKQTQATVRNIPELTENDMLRMFMPQCACGTVLLAIAYQLVKERGRKILPSIGFTGTDSNRLYVRVAMCQFLAYSSLDNIKFGELQFYHLLDNNVLNLLYRNDIRGQKNNHDLLHSGLWTSIINSDKLKH